MRRLQSEKGGERPGASDVAAVEVAMPERPAGMIILPVTMPLRPASRGLRQVATELQDRGFAAFLAELLTPEETGHGYHHFDFEMLADRIAEITEGLRRKAQLEDLPIGYFGTSTDAAAMAIAAARSDSPADAMVMYGARPELVSVELPRVRAPTLFIVEDGGLVLDLNRAALDKLHCRCDLTVVRGAGKGLASPDVASKAARLAGDWFKEHLGRRREN